MKNNEASKINLEHFDDYYREKEWRGDAIITSHYGDRFALFLNSLPENGLILDHGCGTGFTAQLLISEGFRVDCLDISPVAIKKCKEFFELSGFTEDQYNLFTQDFLTFKYPESKYDGIIDYFSLHFVQHEDQKKILESIYKSLKPGGIFYLSVMLIGSIKIEEPHSWERENGATLLKVKDIETPRCFYLWDPYKIRAVLATIGFKILVFYHPMTSIYFVLQKEK